MVGIACAVGEMVSDGDSLIGAQRLPMRLPLELSREVHARTSPA
jgi:hypothetical protein